MRFLIPALFALLLASCVSKQPVPPAAIPVTLAATPISAPPPAAVVSEPAAPAKAASGGISGITFTGVTFDSRAYRLVVVDQPDGPGSMFADAAAAARARDGVAAINAGFFTPEGAPLGLVMASGKISGSWNSASSLGSGVWHAGASGAPRISRRENLGRAAATGMRELIQAGPLLVENGRAVSGLESSKSSARSVILWDGGTRWWIGCSTPCTLDALAQALAEGQPAGWPVRQALNLDGGRSADLWVSSSVSGGPISQRPPWNRPVRNFLVLVPD
jgi:hypothetical protein